MIVKSGKCLSFLSYCPYTLRSLLYIVDLVKLLVFFLSFLNSQQMKTGGEADCNIIGSPTDMQFLTAHFH